MFLFIIKARFGIPIYVNIFVARIILQLRFVWQSLSLESAETGLAVLSRDIRHDTLGQLRAVGLQLLRALEDLTWACVAVEIDLFGRL